MPKMSGSGQRLIVDGVDISGSVTAIGGANVSVNLAAHTGLDKYALERIALLASGSLQVATWFDPTGSHDAFKDSPQSDAEATLLFPGGAGQPVAHITAEKASYSLTRSADASFTGAADFQSTGGSPLVWGKQLSVGAETFVGAAQTISLDSGAGTTGGYWFVQCLALTGTDVIIDLETSSDDGVGDGWASYGGGSVTFAAVGGEMIAIPDATAVEQYVRADISGTFTSTDLLIGYAHG